MSYVPQYPDHETDQIEELKRDIDAIEIAMNHAQRGVGYWATKDTKRRERDVNKYAVKLSDARKKLASLTSDNNTEKLQ